MKLSLLQIRKRSSQGILLYTKAFYGFSQNGLTCTIFKAVKRFWLFVGVKKIRKDGFVRFTFINKYVIMYM